MNPPPSTPLHIGRRHPLGGRPVTLSAQEALLHCYLVGKTGSGKSTLLHNLFTQLALLGYGVGVIDVHGDLADGLLGQIPPWRADDLVHFDAGDRDFPMAFNPLGAATVPQRPLVASGIVEAFRHLWPDSWGPRLEYLLLNAVHALLHCENASLLGIGRMMTDDGYRRWVANQVADPFVRAFWLVEFESWDARFRREAIAPVQNKVGRLLLHPAIRHILGQVRNRIDFRRLMDRRGLFVANLAKGAIGADAANLLGSLVVSQFGLAAMSRADGPETGRVPFFLLVDEFQNFTTQAFAGLLSEARKFGLSLTLAHQFTAQLPEPIREAVFGNVGNVVAFRVGARDAALLEQAFGGEFRAQQFVDLPPYEALARIQDGGTGSDLRIRTFEAMTWNGGRPENLIRRSRERFATPRALVEGRLERWMGDRSEEGRGGRRRMA